MKRFMREHLWQIVIIVIIGGILALLATGCGHRAPPAPRIANPFSSAGNADTNALLVWMIMVSIAGIGACVAAAIFLPVKQLAVAGASGFATVLVLALTLKAALPFLPWVALGLFLIAGALVIVRFRKYVLGTDAAVRFGVDMTKADTQAEAELVKIKHATSQEKLGVRSLIDGILDAVATNNVHDLSSSKPGA